MHIDILQLFPEMLSGVFSTSILKRARDKERVRCKFIDVRDYAENKHKKVDDYPYGGGAGMVLTAQPVFDAVEAVTKNKSAKPRIILMCPQGEPYTQKKAEELAKEEHLV